MLFVENGKKRKKKDEIRFGDFGTRLALKY